jgi:Vanadium chloroperoxidase N-terminal domain/PAP2 superfamily
MKMDQVLLRDEVALAATALQSDPILFWNEVALEANRVSHTNGKNEQTGPTLSSRALAIVHLAMYDAYAGVIKDTTNLPPYIGGIPAPPGASSDAAVAAAAHETLSKLFPSQKPFFDLALAVTGDTSDPGHTFGVAVAQKILADRAGDPNADGTGYVPKQQRGKHRPDPDNPSQGFHAPFYGAKSKGFAITARHELAAPPFDNEEYRKALREVRGKGIAPELMGTLPNNIDPRTVDETLIGIFWGYDGAAGLGTPPRLYNQIVRRLAIARGNSVAKNARLFALVNVAMADAGILAWDQKYIHEFWRPVVGIREHDESMGPAATQADNDISDNCDSSWLPLGAPLTNRIGKNFTPPFPAYPSGHATFGGAAFHITRLFYGVNVGNRQPDNLFNGLDIVSDELNGVNADNKGTVRPRHLRNFPDGGLWQMIEENGRSRVFLGVHWVFDAFAVKNNGDPDLARKVSNKFIGGVPLGLQIAEDIFQAGGGKAPKKSTVAPRA